ncbi:MAG: YtxH domain-containing protein [Armatimonadetes bacterium]|nr:YtxH domain-containing protein [Armatimonadota bacterium]
MENTETTTPVTTPKTNALPFVFGLLVGSLVGAATAIILAPQSGAQTRELISAKANEAKVKAGSYAGELKEDLGEWTEKTKKQVVTKFKERLAHTNGNTPETVQAQ